MAQFAVFLFVLVADIASKHWAKFNLDPRNPIKVIPDLFDLTLVCNKGAAFGMFSSLSDTTRWVSLAVVSVLALGVVLRFMLKEAKGDYYSQLALAGILAGALGNIIDRFRYDCVIDFLDVYVGDYHWPAFNVADSAISVGVAILIFRMVLMPTTVEKSE